MKSRILTFMLIAATILAGCGKAEEPRVQETAEAEASETAVQFDVEFEKVNWEDANFSKTLDIICWYSDTDISAMALACAKGVVEKTNCSVDSAYEAAVEVIGSMKEKAERIEELIFLGRETWNAEEKEEAMALTSAFIASLTEVNEYIALSGTTPEEDLTSIIEYQSDKEEEEEEEEDTAPVEETVEIDWQNEAFITGMEHFSKYDSQTLSQIIDQYAGGLAVISGMEKDDLKKDVKKIVQDAKQNAVTAIELYTKRDGWTDATEAAAADIAAEFVKFVNDYKMYSAALAEASAPAASETDDSENTPAFETEAEGSEASEKPTGNIEEGSEEND